MNRVIIINGSPKKKDSTSGRLIEALENIMGRKLEKYHALSLLHEENYTNIMQADTIVVVFPLYVDALPSHLLRLLLRLEAYKKTLPYKPRLFAVCVCGFSEGSQTRTALHIMRNFAGRAGFHWRYGVGIGGGGVVAGVKNMVKGPGADIHTALCRLAGDIEKKGEETSEDVFVEPKMPKFLYRMGGNMGWHELAKANGVRGRMRDKPMNI